MADSPDTAFRFGPFRYDAVQRLLFRDGELVQLPPKAVDLLHLLLQRRGEAVAKDELIKALWPDCVVEEIGLPRNVSILRKALGGDADTYIETIPKRGYRFTAAEPAPSLPKKKFLPTWLTVSAAVLVLTGVVYWQFYRPSRYFSAAAGARLAVLPLDRLNPDLEASVFGSGISDALATELSRPGRIQVLSPDTVRRYRRIGVPTALMSRLLGLDAVVDGTAQKFGPMARISIRLNDAHSGQLIWAESYDVAAGDPGSVEMTVSRAAAAQINARISPR